MAGNRARGSDKELLVNLVGLATGNVETYIDGLSVQYNAGYLAGTADDDDKTAKPGENLSSYRENKDLSDERRPLFAASDTIFLHLTNTGISSYRFKIHMVNFALTGLVARLEDNYLHSSRVLDTYGGTDHIDFAVNADTASTYPFRFRIVYITARPLPVTIRSFTASRQGREVALQWKISNALHMLQYEVERSADGNHFGRLAIVPAGGGEIFEWNDSQAMAGTGFYRICCVGIAGDIVYSSIVKIQSGTGPADIEIYPNPVSGGQASLHFTGMQKGFYQFRLINSSGQTAGTNRQLHTGISTTMRIRFVPEPVPGNYVLEITGPADLRISRLLMVGQ